MKRRAAELRKAKHNLRRLAESASTPSEHAQFAHRLAAVCLELSAIERNRANTNR